MFSQSKQSQPTFKFIIRSDLSTSASSTGDDTTTSTTTLVNESSSPVSTEHNTSSTDPPTSSTHGLAIDPANIDRKRKRADKGGLLAAKKVHSCLERWGQSQEDLMVSQKELGEEKETLAQQYQPTSQSTGHADSLDMDFGDYQLLACLLCNRKFKSKQDITRHQALSDLHKKNSQDPIAIDKARTKLRQQATKQPATSSTILNIAANSSAEIPITYRNRAAERRQTYSQPECPNLEEQHYNRRPPPIKSDQHTDNTNSFESGTSLTKPVADDNVGAKMLKRMGWKKGQGLGKEGVGIVDPVTADRYAQGAGLGSANAKSRIDSGGSHSYKDRAKELARRRLQEEL